VLGPEEVGDDWFGLKHPFETSVGVVNKVATRRARRFLPFLQELENHLPVPPALRGRTIGSSATLVVLEAVYQGQSGGGSWIGYGLPDDEEVSRAVGKRTGLYRNLLAARYRRMHEPIARAVLQPAEFASLQFDDVADEIAMVRLFDGLGPQSLASGRPFSDALEDTTETVQQIQSMLLSLWGHQYLIDRGKLSRAEQQSLYAAFLVPALARASVGLASSAAKGSTYILNRLLDAKAIQFDTAGHALIDPRRARAAVIEAIREFVPLAAAGDVDAVRSQLRRYVTISPELRAVLQRVAPHDAEFVPVFVSAGKLDGG